MPVFHEVEVSEVSKSGQPDGFSAKEKFFRVCMKSVFHELDKPMRADVTRTLFSREEDYEIQMHFCRFTS